MKRTILGAALIQFVMGAASLHAQPKTRAEEIDEARREKIARLWPERKSPMVDIVNGFVERGLLDDSEGAGANGFQFVLGGMRSGQGASFGKPAKMVGEPAKMVNKICGNRCLLNDRKGQQQQYFDLSIAAIDSIGRHIPNRPRRAGNKLDNGFF